MDEVQLKYQRNNSWGIAISVDLNSCNPELIRDRNKIRQFAIDLCNLLEVQRFGECMSVNFGNSKQAYGYSMVQLIDTSLISGHFANQTNSAYLDIFSCKYCDPKKVAQFAKKFFQAKYCRLNYLFRR